MSPMLTSMPGRVRLRFVPQRSAGRSWACSRDSTTRRGDRIHMRALRSTGQTASWPASGSRRMLLAKVEAALLGLPGRTHDGRQAQGAAVDEALAAVVVDQQLADRLLRAVGGLRRQRRVVGQGRRHVAAEHRDRAGEDQARGLRQRAAGFEHGAGAVEIDAHAQIEIGLGGGADDGGEMEHAVGVGRRWCGRRRARSAMSPVTARTRLSGVGRAPARRCRTARARRSLRLAVAPGSSPSASSAPPIAPDETGAAGDDDFHLLPSVVSAAALMADPARDVAAEAR